jgi:protein-S-isoprenylcysteine O-methyltransferase Ste14
VHVWFAKAIVLVASLAILVIPHSRHGSRGDPGKGMATPRGPLELTLLALVAVGFLLPLVWVATPVLAFADYPLRLGRFMVGLLSLVAGLGLYDRSHADLDTNWSIALEVKAKHQLVTHGVYRLVRHPMYSALLLYSVGLALVLPNWIAGPWYGGSFAALLGVRLGREERMMLEAFGKDYEAYMARTQRLIPGVW